MKENGRESKETLYFSCFLWYNITIKYFKQSRTGMYEESPDTIGQWCQITSSGSDPKESATEKNRQVIGKGENVR